MTNEELDPIIHAPARLRIMATLAAVADGDTLSFARLQSLIGLTAGNLISHLRKLEETGYIETEKRGAGASSLTTVMLTRTGRKALDVYKDALRELLDASNRPHGSTS